MARARFTSFICGVILAVASAWSNAAVPPLTQPKWAQLSVEQKAILSPLAAEWDSLENFRRAKWLGVAQRFPSMSPEEQVRVQRRMKAWAKLTPEERKLAREKYQALQKTSAEKKADLKQQWQTYKELPDSEKAKLAAEANRKPTPRHPSSGKPASTPNKSATQAAKQPAAVTSPQSLPQQTAGSGNQAQN